MTDHRRVVRFFQKLADRSASSPSFDDAEALEAAEAARDLRSAPRGTVTLWHALASEGVKPANVARTLARLEKKQDKWWGTAKLHARHHHEPIPSKCFKSR